MKALGQIMLIVLLVAVVALGAAFFLLPREATITKTVDVARPVGTAYAYLAATPAGAPFGDGTATVVETKLNESVGFDVTGADGVVTRATYTVAPAEGGSKITLATKKDLGANPIGRLQGITGGGAAASAVQAQLDAVAAEVSALPEFDFSTLRFDVVDQIPARPFIYVQSPEGPNDPASIKSGLLQAMSLINGVLAANPGVKVVSKPISVETKWDEAANLYAFQAGVAFEGPAPQDSFFVKIGQTPSGAAIRVPYQGAEDTIIPVYDQIEALIAAGRLTKAGPSFEEYMDDPATAAGSTNRVIYHIVSGDLTTVKALAAAQPALPAPATVPALPAPAPAAATPAAATPAPATPAPATTP